MMGAQAPNLGFVLDTNTDCCVCRQLTLLHTKGEEKCLPTLKSLLAIYLYAC